MGSIEPIEPTLTKPLIVQFMMKRGIRCRKNVLSKELLLFATSIINDASFTLKYCNFSLGVLRWIYSNFFNSNRPDGCVSETHAAFDCFSFLYEWRKLSFHSWVFKLNTFVSPKESIFQYLSKFFEKWHSEHTWSSSILNQNWTNLM